MNEVRTDEPDRKKKSAGFFLSFSFMLGWGAVLAQQNTRFSSKMFSVSNESSWLT
jgi:hypothetical protein